MSPPKFLRNGTAELVLGSTLLFGGLAFHFTETSSLSFSSLQSSYTNSIPKNNEVHESLRPSTKTTPLFPCRISKLPTGIGFDGPLSYKNPKLNQVRGQREELGALSREL